MAPPPELPEELVEEILLRVPPDDPATLLRAALVCKSWCRLISGAAFRRRFRELHPAPPMLGFLYQRAVGTDFVPASSFRPPHAFRGDWRVVDARHGRVLALDVGSGISVMQFVVWDPVTDDLRRLPIVRLLPLAWSAVVLCATAGCDHLDCRGGPFLVVGAATDLFGERCTSAIVYSSEQGAWSEPITMQHHSDRLGGLHALVGNAGYFNFLLNTGILEFDLGRREMSIIDLPSEFYGWHIVPMDAEDGGLGFATVQESKLSLWSRKAGQDRYAGWVQQRVIELDKLLPVSDRNIPVSRYAEPVPIADPPYVVAVADSVGVIFMWTDDGLFRIHLKSGRVERMGNFISTFGVVPYTSFCSPALSLASTGDE